MEAVIRPTNCGNDSDCLLVALSIYLTSTSIKRIASIFLHSTSSCTLVNLTKSALEWDYKFKGMLFLSLRIANFIDLRFSFPLTICSLNLSSCHFGG